jgi:hypothetical protein
VTLDRGFCGWEQRSYVQGLALDGSTGDVRLSLQENLCGYPDCDCALAYAPVGDRVVYVEPNDCVIR